MKLLEAPALHPSHPACSKEAHVPHLACSKGDLWVSIMFLNALPAACACWHCSSLAMRLNAMRSHDSVIRNKFDYDYEFLESSVIQLDTSVSHQQRVHFLERTSFLSVVKNAMFLRRILFCCKREMFREVDICDNILCQVK